nr:MAG TPA: nuclease [Caudoviricetes sp.]
MTDNRMKAEKTRAVIWDGSPVTTSLPHQANEKSAAVSAAQSGVQSGSDQTNRSLRAPNPNKPESGGTQEEKKSWNPLAVFDRIGDTSGMSDTDKLKANAYLETWYDSYGSLSGLVNDLAKKYESDNDQTWRSKYEMDSDMQKSGRAKSMSESILSQLEAGKDTYSKYLGRANYDELVSAYKSLHDAANAVLSYQRGNSEAYGKFQNAEEYALPYQSSDVIQKKLEEAKKTYREDAMKTGALDGNNEPTGRNPRKDKASQDKNNISALEVYLKNALQREVLEKYNVDLDSLSFDEFITRMGTAARRDPEKYKFYKEYYDLLGGDNSEHWDDLRAAEFMDSLSEDMREKYRDAVHEQEKATANAGGAVARDSGANGNPYAKANKLKSEIMSETGIDEEKYKANYELAARYVHKEDNEKEKAKLKDKSGWGLVLPYLTSVPANGIGALPAIVDQVVQSIEIEKSGNPYKSIDPYSGGQAFSNYAQNVRNEIAERTSNNKIANFVINTLTSTLDSAFASLVGAGIGAAAGATGKALQHVISTTSGLILGSSAATSATQDALSRGFNSRRAVAYGLLTGAAENLTEHIGTDVIVGAIIKGGKVGKTLLKSALSEGAEEVANNLLQGEVVERIFNGNEGRVETLYKLYIEDGYPMDEAMTKAIADVHGEDVETFLSAALSGVMMSGTGVIANRKAFTRTKQAIDTRYGEDSKIKAYEWVQSKMKNADAATVQGIVENLNNVIEDANTTAGYVEKNSDLIEERERGTKISVAEAEASKIRKFADSMTALRDSIQNNTYTDADVSGVIGEMKENLRTGTQADAVKAWGVKKAAKRYAQAYSGNFGEIVGNLRKTFHAEEAREKALMREHDAAVSALNDPAVEKAAANRRLTEIESNLKDAQKNKSRALDLLTYFEHDFVKSTNRMLGGTADEISRAITGEAGNVRYDVTAGDNENAAYHGGKIDINPLAVTRGQAAQSADGIASASNFAREQVAHEGLHMAIDDDPAVLPRVMDIYASLKKEGLVTDSDVNEAAIRAAYAPEAEKYVQSAKGQAAVRRLIESGTDASAAAAQVREAYVNEEIAGQFVQWIERSGGDVYGRLVGERKSAFARAVQKIAEFFRSIAAKLRGTDAKSARQLESVADRIMSAVEDFAGYDGTETKTEAKTTLAGMNAMSDEYLRSAGLDVDAMRENSRAEEEAERVLKMIEEADVPGTEIPRTESASETADVDTEDGVVSRYSYNSWTKAEEQRVARALVQAGYERGEVEQWISNVNSVSAIIAANRNRLDYAADESKTAVKPNKEYRLTVDFSTLCEKRRLYQGTFDLISHMLKNSPLLSDDVLKLREMMADAGDATPCAVCYVESRRRFLGKFASEWLSSYDGSYKPTLDEVTTSDGLEALRSSDDPAKRQAYADFVRKMKTKGTQSPKIVELRTDYRGEIGSFGKRRVNSLNKAGGLRIQSFSDFETPHLLDMMQVVTDMTAKGLRGQAYTKIPNFAEVFGGTGIKINLSLIADGTGFDADGNLAFSATEGMNIDDAVRLREMYPEDVGTIIVGESNEHILACMADDRIDFIIPFHKSGWSAETLNKMNMSGYSDYTDFQNERDAFTGKRVKENYVPSEYWDYAKSGKENAETYLRLCAENDRIPKFDNFLTNNGDGSYSLKADGSTDGYWKLLVDFRMYDNDGNGAPQKVVQPNFNMEAARRVLSEYTGGADVLPADKAVAERFVEWYRDTHGREFEESEKKFSLASPVEETKDLLAVHNMTEANLRGALQLGGLPMPSIAIVKRDAGHSEYGPISVLFRRKTIDPASDRRNRVYGGDAWTPVFPRVEYKADKKVEKRVRDKYYELSRKYGYESTRAMQSYEQDLSEKLTSAGGEAAMLEKLYGDEDMMQIYLEDTGRGHVENVVREVKTVLTDEQARQYDILIDTLGREEMNRFAVKDGESPISVRKAFLERNEAGIREAFARTFTENGMDAKTAAEVSGELDRGDLMKYVREAYKYMLNGRETVKHEIDYEATKDAIREKAGSGYRKWVQDLFGGAEEKSGIRNNKDMFTASGNRRSFDALHYELTLENVVRAMREEEQKGGGSLFGGQSIWGAATKDYGSIGEIKADSGRLGTVSEDEYKAIRQKYTERFAEIANEIKDSGADNSFIAADDAAEILVDVLRKRKTVAAIDRELRKYSQLNIQSDTAQKAYDLFRDISNMPTGYFEAKPQRAVGFDEAAAVIVPQSTDSALTDELRSAGVRVETYTDGDEAARLDTLNRVADEERDVRFSKALDKEYMELAKDPEGNAVELEDMVLDAAESSGFQYRRQTYREHAPQKDVPYQMFARGLYRNLSGYGDYVYFGTDVGATQIEDILPKLRELSEEFYGEVISDEVLNPPDIVITAGVWDDPDFVQYMWDNYFEDEFLRTGKVPAVVTDDGMIVLGRDDTRVKSGSNVEYDDDGNVIPLSERFNSEKDDIRYSKALDREYMDAVQSGDVDKAREMVREAADKAGYTDAIPEQASTYTVRTKASPKKTIKVYKVFTVAPDGSPTALFVSSTEKLPQNVWLDAVDTYHFRAANGKEYVPSTQNPYTQGGKTGASVEIPNDTVRQELVDRGYLPADSKAKKITALAYRPGWHAGDLPFFPQGGKKGNPRLTNSGNVNKSFNPALPETAYENIHRYNQVVFECEMAADVDYTETAQNQDKAKTKAGSVNQRNADLQYMPKDGFYYYTTNPTISDKGKWVISGSLKINRALTQAECDAILKENGYRPQEWEGGNLDLAALGYTGEQHDAARKTLAPITYDDGGNVIPLSERFNSEKDDIRWSKALDRESETVRDGMDNGDASIRYSKSAASREAEIARLKERIAEDKDFLRRQTEKPDMPDAHRVTLSPAQVQRLSDKVRKNWDIAKSEEGKVKRLFGMTDDLMRTAGRNYDTVRAEMETIARELLDGVAVYDREYAARGEELRKWVKGMKLYLGANEWSDIAPDGKAEFKKRNGKYIHLTDERGTGTISVDQAYSEMLDMFPDMLDPNAVTPQDQVLEIIEAVKAREPKYVNPYDDDMSGAVDEFVNGILADYASNARTTYGTLRDMREAQLKLKYKEQLGKVQEKAQAERDAAVAAERDYRVGVQRKTVNAYEARLARIQANAERAAMRFTQELNDSMLREREASWNTTRREMAARIRVQAGALHSAAVSPTQKRFVPEAYRQNVDRIANWMRETANNTTGRTNSAYLSGGIRGDIRALGGLFGDDFTDTANLLLDMADDAAAVNVEDTKSGSAVHVLRSVSQLGGMMRKMLADQNRAVLDGKRMNAQTVGSEIARHLSRRKFTAKEFDSLSVNKSGKLSGGFSEKMANELKNFELGRMDGARFLHLLGAQGDALYETLRDAQTEQVMHVQAYVDYLTENLVKDKEHPEGIDMSKYLGRNQKKITLTLSGGREITMTAAQAMNIVSLYERASGRDHIENGGVRLLNPETNALSRAIPMNSDDIRAIRAHLDADDVRVMNVMNRFLRETVTEWGNEATMNRYGFRRFTADNYFPISVDKNALAANVGASDAQGATDFKVENMSFTKKTKENAATPVVIGNYIDMVNRHVEGMASYAAYLVPEDTVNRILSVPGVQDAMQRALGSLSVQNLKEIMSELKGAGSTEAVADRIARAWDIGSNAYKAAAVSYNPSTAMKQPLSYIRAAALIDPKYLAQGLHLKGRGDEAHAQMMKYSGIGVKKANGYSEVGVAKTVGDQIGFTKNDFSEGLAKFTEFGMKGAEFGDTVTWDALWIACREEVRDKNPGLVADEDAWMKATAKRFGRVVAQTQVVDSPLDSARIMRSKKPFIRTVMAFQNEPLKTYNLMMTALDDVLNTEKRTAAHKAAVKQLARSTAVCVVSTLAEAAVSAGFRALRDNDDDFFGALTDDYLNEVFSNTGNFFPYLSAIQNIIADGFSDIGTANAITLFEDIMKLGTAIRKRDTSQITVVQGVRRVVESLASVAGVPLKNINRTLVNVVKAFNHATDNYVAEYNLQRFFYNPKSSSARERYEFASLLADAYDAGDIRSYEYMVEDLKKSGVDVRAIVTSMSKDHGEELDTGKSTLVRWKTGSDGWYTAMQSIFGRNMNDPRATEDEITRLYSATGDTAVLPKFKSGTYTVDKEDRKFTGEKLDEFTDSYGTMLYEILNAMRNSPRYKSASDKDKAYWVAQADKYAGAVCVWRLDKEYPLASRAKWIEETKNMKPAAVAKYILENRERG